MKHVKKVLDLEGLQLEIEPAYLSAIRTKEVFQRISTKTETKGKLSDDELMELIVLPLTVKDRENQRRLLSSCVTLAQDLKEREQQLFAVSGLVTFADKIIDKEF